VTVTSVPREAQAQVTLRRTAVAATLLLGAAALSHRLGGPSAPFLLMAAAVLPQVLALALALRLPGRIGWLKVHLPTTWLLRGLSALTLIGAIAGWLGDSRFWVASLSAAIALGIAGWHPVVVAHRR